MQILKHAFALMLAATLVACGGGGGSAGTTPTGSGGTTTTTPTTTVTAAVPVIALVLTDSAGTTLSVNAITAGSVFYAKATVTNAGTPVSNQLVSFSTDTAIGNLASGSALTDSTGVARVRISPASVGSSGAAILTASALVSGNQISADLAYQTSAANVVLGVPTASPASISALQSAAVSAAATVNGVAAAAGQVVVTFSAPCGSFSPVTATTSNLGVANSAYFAVGCPSGAVSLTASAPGAPSAIGSIAVTAAQPANILFISATPPTLVVSSAPTGNRQSSVRFQVLDATSVGISGKSVTFTLDTQSVGAGVSFFAGASTTTVAQLVTTNGSGFADVIIQSGPLPTPVILTAALGDTPSMMASSSGIAVYSGKSSQDKSSLSATKLSIEAFNTDGVTTDLTMRVADRQSNPVPAGTVVTFVASHGVVGGACLVDAESKCGVTYTSQGTRPTNGRVTILAYMDGEETFTDLNGNNTWDAGEPFTDMGTVFRDDNENGLSDPLEQTYPGGAVGAVACTADAYPSVTNTCNGTWSSTIRVRRPIVIALATSDATITRLSSSVAVLEVRVSDLNGNGMPTGTTVAAGVGAGGASCAVTSVSPNVVRNSANSSIHFINTNGDPTCNGARIDVTVTTPAARSTIRGFVLP